MQITIDEKEVQHIEKLRAESCNLICRNDQDLSLVIHVKDEYKAAFFLSRILYNKELAKDLEEKCGIEVNTLEFRGAVGDIKDKIKREIEAVLEKF